jgi:hypothetical protein
MGLPKFELQPIESLCTLMCFRLQRKRGGEIGNLGDAFCGLLDL